MRSRFGVAITFWPNGPISADPMSSAMTKIMLGKAVEELGCAIRPRETTKKVRRQRMGFMMRKQVYPRNSEAKRNALSRTRRCKPKHGSFLVFTARIRNLSGRAISSPQELEFQN